MRCASQSRVANPFGPVVTSLINVYFRIYSDYFVLNVSNCRSCIDFRLRSRAAPNTQPIRAASLLWLPRNLPALAPLRQRLFCCIFVVNHSPWPCATSSGPLHTTEHPSPYTTHPRCQFRRITRAVMFYETHHAIYQVNNSTYKLHGIVLSKGT